MAHPISLSIVFSFRNEEEVLSELVQRVRQVLKKEQEDKRLSFYELIFINDASTDRSVQILQALIRGQKDIRVVNLSRRFGVTAGVIAGLAYASGDAVVYMDSDLQDPPEVISQMLDLWFAEPGTDVIHTVRQRRKGEGPIKLAVTRMGYVILNRITRLQLPMEAGDFKMLSRRAVEHLLRFREKKPYLRGLVCWIGFKQKFLNYVRDPRFAGRTKFPILSRDVIRNFTDSALISFSSTPLKIASLLGLFAIFVDILVLIHALSEKLQGRAIPGWTAIMVVIVFLGGVQLFCLGILGLYLNAIFEQSVDRPRYIVESTAGFPPEFHQKIIE